MRGVFFLVGGTLAIAASALCVRPMAQARFGGDGALAATPSPALEQARDQAARARDRAIALDRQARAATLASERAVLAAAALAARVQQSEASLASAETELAALRGQRRALARRLAAERAPVARLVAGLQTQARRPALLVLLQPGSVSDAVHLRAVIAAVTPQVAVKTASLRASLRQARALERTAAALSEDRRALQSALLARRGELAALSAAERLRARRAGEAADREAARAFAIAEQARSLPALVRQLDSSAREPIAPRGAGRGATTRSLAMASGPAAYRLPVAGPLAGSAETVGEGVIILARPGALVVAPGAGRVAFAGPYRGYGEIVIIEHPQGFTSLVTGLARTRVVVGQPLVAGSPIGEAPANTARIGLELRWNGRTIDPLAQIR